MPHHMYASAAQPLVARVIAMQIQQVGLLRNMLSFEACGAQGSCAAAPILALHASQRQLPVVQLLVNSRVHQKFRCRRYQR